MKVTYRSNNSGGAWWLKDEDWLNLERAGWTVEWGAPFYCNSRFSFATSPLPWEPAVKCEKDCGGHWAPSYQALKDYPDGRYMRTSAVSAWIDASSIKVATAMWEDATGMDADEEGCSCCGQPHSFYDW